METLTITFLLSFCLFITDSETKAQGCPARLCAEAVCPEDAPPTQIGWTQGCKRYNNVEVCPGVFCDLLICYCHRHTAQEPLDPTKGWDYTITQIVPLNCGNCSVSIQTLVDKAYEVLFKDNPAGFPCPPCGVGSTMEWQEARARCFKTKTIYYDDPAGGPPIPAIAAVPCQSSGWCYKKYSVCCINGVPTRTLISAQTYGECAAEGCTTIYCQ